ncbi:MAG: substrate-binding domain-containing protein [Pseudomonadota bacterium]
MTDRKTITPGTALDRRRFLKMGAAGAAAVSMGAGSAALAQSKPLLGFSNKSLDFYFFRIMEESAKRTTEALDWEFQATNASFDSTLQLQQWQSLMAKNPIALIGATVDSQAMVSAVRKANARNIPVGMIDSLANGGDVAASVSFDNNLGGVMAAQEVIDRLRRKYGGEAKGVVLNCYGSLQSEAWAARKVGFEEELGKHPGITLLSRPTEGLLNNMLSVTANTLSEYPDLDAVHAPSDTPGQGVVTALRQRGKWKKIDEEGHVIFVTIDGEPGGIQHLLSGHQDADVSQDAIGYGAIAIELIARYVIDGGGSVPLGMYENDAYFWEEGEIVDSVTGPRLIIPPFSILPENAADPRHWGNIAVNDWGFAYG